MPAREIVTNLIDMGKRPWKHVWEWAGRVDDRAGRLRVLYRAAFGTLALVIVLAVIATILFGPLGAVLISLFGILALIVILKLRADIKESTLAGPVAAPREVHTALQPLRVEFFSMTLAGGLVKADSPPAIAGDPLIGEWLALRLSNTSYDTPLNLGFTLVIEKAAPLYPDGSKATDRRVRERQMREWKQTWPEDRDVLTEPLHLKPRATIEGTLYFVWAERETPSLQEVGDRRRWLEIRDHLTGETKQLGITGEFQNVDWA